MDSQLALPSDTYGGLLSSSWWFVLSRGEVCHAADETLESDSGDVALV